MIVLDTNIVSEVMRVAPDPTVLSWLAASDSSTFYLSTITIAVIVYRLQILPVDQCRRAINDRFERFVEQGFAHRVRDFDGAAAFMHGQIMARRKRLGRPLSILDGQNVSMASVNSMTVATRNTADFEDTRIELVNPWGVR